MWAALAAVAAVVIGLTVVAGINLGDPTIATPLLDGALCALLLGGVGLVGVRRRQQRVTLVGHALQPAGGAAPELALAPRAERGEPPLLNFNERPPAAPAPGLLGRLLRRRPPTRDEREVILAPAGVWEQPAA